MINLNLDISVKVLYMILTFVFLEGNSTAKPANKDTYNNINTYDRHSILLEV